MLRAALIQTTSIPDVSKNFASLKSMIGKAKSGGASLILTPEVSNILGANKKKMFDTLKSESEDPFLFSSRNLAAKYGIWLLLGSLALKLRTSHRMKRDFFVNRSFLISPNGIILARYDKIHMFDVKLLSGVEFNESKIYKNGVVGVVIKLPNFNLGLSICYDLRFPKLYKELAEKGAEILCIPSAFTQQTGYLHWEILLRARAIENRSFVLAPAQCGDHGNGRSSWGHSLAIDFFGNILVDAGSAPGVNFVDLDVTSLRKIRKYSL